MSDEIDLNQRQVLCTSEDAFEKFQAISMYEEDEYISLSDIVPPQPAAPDFSGEINDIPYENEVVLESNLEEQVPEVNSTIEISTDENPSSERPLEEQQQNLPQEVPAPDENRPAKRGRKKKCQPINQLTNTDSSTNQNKLADIASQDNEAIALTPTPPRKRGRPSKNVIQTQQNNVTADLPGSRYETSNNSPIRSYKKKVSLQKTTNDDTTNDNTTHKKTPERGNTPIRTYSRKTTTNNDTTNDNTAPKKTSGRGRRKKSIPHQPVNKDSSIPELEEKNVSLSNDEDITPPVQIKKKRGRKPRITVSHEPKSSYETHEEMDKPDLPVDNSSSDVPLEPSIKKGKRGRPKRVLTEEKSDSGAVKLEEIVRENLENEDDDADDICLSQLKNSIEEVKDSKTVESNGEVNYNKDVKVCEKLPAEDSKNEECVPIKETDEVVLSIKETDEVVLSIKETDEVVQLQEKEVSRKRNLKQPIMQDFEYNIDSIVSETRQEIIETENNPENEELKDSLLVEDTTKRPVRRKARQSMHYDEGSDEDPFANIELSDDDDMRGRKGRYYSDDEYIPGVVKKRGSKHEVSADTDTDTSDSDIDNIDEEIRSMNSKHKRFRKSDGSPYKKRGRKSKEESALLAKGKTGRFSPEVSTIKPDEKNLADDDVEICLETSVIKAPNETKASWGTTHEFENFLAKKIQGTDIKIKKASAPVQPLEIPVIDPNEAKKTIEIFTQTTEIKTKSTGIQTSAPFDAPMKSNVSLTAEQSEKACEFLNSIVKTTAELGELMTQKSEDFIKKKINTNHVTDTFKMDYCVRKSFLLFKLAKHNLMQMEEDLAKQYDDFLDTHNLSQHRDTPKVLKADPKPNDSDSDCEIIETPAVKNPTKKETSSFIPKTVFLNKELSIKIAKKPTDDKKINIKGRHTVWINDSVMVKKVKPTQSFLAQDSRNKKPPDFVTIEMVNAFFEAYNHKRASETCAPFVSPEWLTPKSVYVCNYFFASTEEFPTTTGMPSGSGHCQNVEDEELSASNMNDNSLKPPEGNLGTSNPKTLLSLCTLVLQNCLHHTRSNVLDVSAVEDKVILDKKHNPESLFQLSLKSINKTYLHNEKEEEIGAVKDCIHNAPSLKTMCYKKMVEILSIHRTVTDDSPCSPIHHNNEIIDCNPESDEDLLSASIKPKSPMPLYDEKLFVTDLANKYMNGVKPWTNIRRNGLKSLFSLCFDLINIKLSFQEKHNFYNNLKPSLKLTDLKNRPKSLKLLAYNLVVNLIFEDENKPIRFADKCADSVTKKKVKTLADLCFEIVTKAFVDSDNQTPQDGLTINAVNTLTEEAYHNIDQSELSENGDNYYPDDDNNVFDEETEICDNNQDNTSHMEDNWLSQVQMEVNSCFDPNISIPENISQEQAKNALNAVTRIKIEPVEEVSETVDMSIVKSEPVGNLDEMTIIPESIVTKSEFSDLPTTSREPIQRQNSSSFDGDQFEAFASTNKMMYSLNNYENEDEIFSQSASRIRRQYEPDSDTENDMTQDCMGLLVPQTYEPMPIIEKDKVKNTLMESSEDENNSSNNKKLVKKKPEKRGRGRTKKNDPKPAVNKETTKDKPTGTNEIAMLTRKMREKIRQEEKKDVSSDSEHENDKVISKKGKEKHKSKTKTAHSEETDDKQNKTSSDKMEHTETKSADDEIQCSNVDSTEQVNEIFGSVPRTMSPSLTNFSGFSALDQNEITSYQKYVKYVYDQILPKVTGEENKCQTNTDQPVINPDEPVELLECEPTMPFLMEEHSKPPRTSATKRAKAAKKEDLETTATTTVMDENSPPLKTTETKKGKSLKNEMKDNIQLPKTDENTDLSKINTSKEENLLYIERHGWKCYPLNGTDNKLYQNAQILLEKLPESFVETYFKYQDVTHKDKEDEEVDRLINLQTLNRTSAKDSASEEKPNRCKGRPKCKIQPQVKDAVFSILGLNAEDDFSGINSPDRASPANSEHFNELAPSDDEGGKIDEEIPVAVEKPPSDNNLAKSSLMNDKDSDDETKIKEEPTNPEAADAETKSIKKNKPGPKSKKLKEKVPTAPVMLTADKMMNKELNLLHAPVNIIDDDDTKIQTPVKSGPVTRNSKQKSASKTSPKERIKNEDDSSSEEEKQWFTIKEKLLKRMVKKHDTTREDDAKRAKLVSEFIERRGDGTESYLKKRRGTRGPRSKKKFLERQKQLRVLTRELFGDPSNDTSLQRKKQTAAYFKGRRNIRKVLDKKSLAKSTVVANMEEFERKRRLTIRQSKLREVLRCEEGVNVLVINDELCLEYDFDQNRPVVTVHPFFTKVMKAHQYEGVKFMWDACFESLESLAAGKPGGGCILAHCMGLGKTLQVLALLHTVLTHPGVGMQRVLVCCPLSTVLNWVDEIHKWIGPVTNQIKVFELSKLRKTYERAYQLEDWYNGGGIFIIGYELFRSLTTLDPFLDDVRPTIINKIRTALLEPGPDIIICDEGHLLKNDCSVLAVAMSRVATRRRIVLTGTPMQNNLREYYCMVNFVKPNLLGTYAEYSNRFENPIMNGQHRDSREEDIKLMKARTHILHKVLEGCLQRQEASVLYPYLPKKHEYTVFISLTKCQWDLYKHYLSNYGNTQNNKSILKDFHILQKIWSHPQVLHNFQMRVCDEAKVKAKLKVEKLEDDLASEDLKEKEIDLKPSDREVWWLQYLEGGAMLDSLASSNKFATVFRILDESVALGDKVLIFSTSLFTMDALEFFLKKINKWSLGQEYYRLDGSVPAEVRQKWCREFNAENNLKTRLFLISTRAGSLGLNMTAANRVIILDTSWNPAHDIQSIFRVYRFGQKKDCYIYRLVALGTMEQKIYERSVTKQAVACRVVDEQQIDRHYNMADLTELYKYDETGVGVAGGVAVGVEDVVLLRVARDAALHAVHEHDSLLRGSGEQGLPEHERNAAWMQFQQEHANKQMQEDALQQALLAQKLKQEELAEKRPTRKYAKLKMPIKPEETEESILPEPAVTLPAGPRPRGRRAKLNNVVTCRIPIQPEAAEASSFEREATIVRKIAEILQEYNFQQRWSQQELSALVERVHHIVASGQAHTLDPTDTLTMRIANVFLGRDEEPMPALTDVAPGPFEVKDEVEVVQAPPPKTRGRKKGSGRKAFVVEEIPSTSAAPTPPVQVEGSRTRRRAALEAERNFDEEVEVDAGDGDWQNDNDSDSPISEIKLAKDTQTAPQPAIQYPPSEKRQRKLNSRQEAKVKVEESHSIADVEAAKKAVILDSILLSDDDEPPPQRKPGPARRTGRRPQTVESPEEPAQPVSEPSTDEPIPLHPTLLGNKNFIKIVAHTYLTGNPMLDEDAATLAAQYSTFKALKEYESTKKDIVSGPLHDIAVKVLGINVLQLLHQSKTQVVTKDIIDSHPINSKVESPSRDTPAAELPPSAAAPPPAPTPAHPENKAVKIRIRIPPLPANLAAAGDATQPSAGNVVPVGLYKRAEEGPSSTADECILPDDDDIRIVSAPTPTPTPVPPVPIPPPAPVTPAAAPKPLPKIYIKRRNVTPLVITGVKPAPAAPPPASEEILSDLPPTISLDSDDDEPAAAPQAPPAPAPVLAPPTAPGSNIVLIPASTYGGAAVVPVALSRGSAPAAPPGQLTCVPAASVPISVQNIISSQIAPATSAAPRLPPAVLPPVLDLPRQAGKRVCKPGDILRITKTGGFEVLRSHGVPPEIGSSARPAPAESPAPPRSTPDPHQPPIVVRPSPAAKVPAAAPPAKAPTAAPPAKAPAAAPPAKASAAAPPTPASRSSGSVAEDPLSILRNVVHIEADDYPADNYTVKKKDPPPSRAAVKPSTPKIPETPSTSRAAGKPSERAPAEGKWHKVLSHNTKQESPVKPVAPKNFKPDQNRKPTHRTEFQVDLTDDDVPPKTGPSVSSKLVGLKRATTIIGTSKSIILCGSGKAIAKTNLGAVKRDTIVKQVEPSPAAKNKVEKKIIVKIKSEANNKVEVKKRPAIIASGPVKKKKTDKPMTLKDFDIDDIDDIIELE